ncbi:hypothetical protein J802_4601, partial [Acinetobacter baumannii 45002_9]
MVIGTQKAGLNQNTMREIVFIKMRDKTLYS